MEKSLVLGILLAVSGLLNFLVLFGFRVGRWATRVENPIDARLEMQRLAIGIDGLTKEIQELRAVFDRRYTGLEGRYDSDHVKLRDVITREAVTAVEIRELRRDVDNLLAASTYTDGLKAGAKIADGPGSAK